MSSILVFFSSMSFQDIPSCHQCLEKHFYSLYYLLHSNIEPPNHKARWLSLVVRTTDLQAYHLGSCKSRSDHWQNLFSTVVSFLLVESFDKNLHANCCSCVTGSSISLANQDGTHRQVHKLSFRYPHTSNYNDSGTLIYSNVRCD